MFYFHGLMQPDRINDLKKRSHNSFFYPQVLLKAIYFLLFIFIMMKGVYSNSIYSTSLSHNSIENVKPISFYDAPGSNFVKFGKTTLPVDIVSDPDNGYQFRAEVLLNGSLFVEKSIYGPFDYAKQVITIAFKDVQLEMQKDPVSPVVRRVMMLDNSPSNISSGGTVSTLPDSVFNTCCYCLLCVLDNRYFGVGQLVNPVDDIANNKIRVISSTIIPWYNSIGGKSIDVPDFYLSPEEDLVLYYVYSVDETTLKDNTEMPVGEISAGVNVSWRFSSSVTHFVQNKN